jgi:hypothetical protein
VDTFIRDMLLKSQAPHIESLVDGRDPSPATTAGSGFQKNIRNNGGFGISEKAKRQKPKATQLAAISY